MFLILIGTTPIVPRVAAFTSEEDELNSISKMTDSLSLQEVPVVHPTADGTTATTSPTSPAPDNSKYRMDVHDFVRYVHLHLLHVYLCVLTTVVATSTSLYL